MQLENLPCDGREERRLPRTNSAPPRRVSPDVFTLLRWALEMLSKVFRDYWIVEVCHVHLLVQNLKCRMVKEFLTTWEEVLSNEPIDVKKSDYLTIRHGTDVIWIALDSKSVHRTPAEDLIQMWRFGFKFEVHPPDINEWVRLRNLYCIPDTKGTGSISDRCAIPGRMHNSVRSPRLKDRCDCCWSNGL